MNRFLKYAGAATLAGALAVAAATPGNAHDWRGGGAAAAAGFAAGAIVGAAATSSYYGDGYYYGDYVYDPGYAYAPAPAYYDSYAYDPGPGYRYRGYYSNWDSQGPGCIQSPASRSYTSCN